VEFRRYAGDTPGIAPSEIIPVVTQSVDASLRSKKLCSAGLNEIEEQRLELWK
jgi:hypothetical protein